MGDRGPKPRTHCPCGQPRPKKGTLCQQCQRDHDHKRYLAQRERMLARKAEERAGVRAAQMQPPATPSRNCRCGRPARYSNGRCQECNRDAARESWQRQEGKRPRRHERPPPAPRVEESAPQSPRARAALEPLRQAVATYLARRARWVAALEIARECGVPPGAVETVMSDPRFLRDYQARGDPEPSWSLAPGKGEQPCA